MSARPIGMMIAVMEAYRDGKQVQMRLRSGGSVGWSRALDPCWDWSQFDYRVKPEPREWWIVVDAYGVTAAAFDNIEAAKNYTGGLGPRRIVHVREVREVIE